MRPARKGPENAEEAAAERTRERASMRPARKGPENLGEDAPWIAGVILLQ